jgi:hypothetical protein
MTNTRPVHVVHRDDGWAVVREGAERASSVGHDTQAAATEAARETARREHTELVVHGRDGQIRRRDSYGNDPHPPQG